MVNARSIVHGLVAARELAAPSTNNFQAFSMSPGFPIAQVASKAESLPTHSWEFGTAAQALLELYNPELSVFADAAIPYQPDDGAKDVKSLAYAKKTIQIADNGRLFGNDGSAGDPASVGVAAVMLGKTEKKYAEAAANTLNFLLNSAPRYENGAISHRVKVPELWADFVYMAPTFIAYYGADAGNATILHEGVKQCGYYRDVLKSDKGVWKHIIGPQNKDLGLWATGNGWAAAGMTRVLATVMKAPIAQDASWKQDATQDLTAWIMEIVDGAMKMPTDGGLLRNYLDNTSDDGHGFGEISGTSMIAATIFRMAVLQPDTFGQKYIDWANGVREKLGGKDAGGNPYITDKGIATPAVNPLAWKDTKPFTKGSPEGQGFVVLMYAAWRDCVSVGKCGGTTPVPVAAAAAAAAAAPAPEPTPPVPVVAILDAAVPLAGQVGGISRKRMHRRRAHSGVSLMSS